jgi:hypothetical protein
MGRKIIAASMVETAYLYLVEQMLALVKQAELSMGHLDLVSVISRGLAMSRHPYRDSRCQI